MSLVDDWTRDVATAREVWPELRSAARMNLDVGRLDELVSTSTAVELLARGYGIGVLAALAGMATTEAATAQREIGPKLTAADRAECADEAAAKRRDDQ